MKLESPKTLKQLRLFLGCVDHLTKHKQNLARISEPLQPLLKKNPEAENNKLNLKEEPCKVLKNVKNKFYQIIENKHFDTAKRTQVKCNASFKVLGATIEQKHNNNWHTITFANSFAATLSPATAQTNLNF